MAQTPPSAGRPGRQLIVLGLISIALFGMMFFSGTSGMSWTERMKPQLGIDLVGGTRVTLQALTEDGSPPAEDQLEQARQIINSRVNALGVEEAEVVSEGEDRIVISVAGEPANALRNVGQPAELRFRKVIEITSGQAPGAAPEQGAEGEAAPTPSPGATPSPPSTPSPGATEQPAGEGGELAAQADDEASPEPTESPQSAEQEPSAEEIGSVEERRARVQEKIDDETMQAAMTFLNPPAQDAQEQPDWQALLEQIRPFEELTGPEVAVLPARMQFYLPTVTCEQLNDRPAGSVQDPDEMVVACDESGSQKYLLDVSKVLGTDIEEGGANARIQAGTNQWDVVLSFTDDGQPKWTDLTREATQNSSATPFDPTQLGMNVTVDPDSGEWQFETSPEAAEQNNLYQPAGEGEAAASPPGPVQCNPSPIEQGGATGDQGNCLVAAVLDTEVVSAPQIQSVIPGDATISGDFTSTEAQTLASQLRFGALPVTFQEQEAQSITATLGIEYLRAGLLAAAIGMGLVILYVFFYYRLLGVVIVGSLIASSLLTYAALVVLGRGIGYTLTLAGISGFIVAVGIAADSFVIYFERLKDEIREGRTARSAVPRAWARARRTIITANAVTLMAALVLYLLAAGQVAGFAFALGLATVLDLLIVFTFRHPLMTLLARTRAFLSPTVSGLGRALELDKARAAQARVTAREAEA